MIARTVRRLIQWSGLLVLLALALCLPLAAHAVTNTWSPAANLAAARSYQTATLLPSGKVLVAGGGDLTGALSGAEVYDSASNTWSPAGQLATARDQPTATLLPSGKVLVVGGADGNGLSLAGAELYDPASNTWSTAGSLAAARYGHTATLLPSGKVLVVGGASSFFFLASAELYDPASNTWSAAGSLAAGREAHTATLLPSGKVLVVGGEGSSFTVITSAELYDPAGDTWSPAGSLTTARYLHTATVLPSGKVLVAGGSNGSGSFASAELYDPAGNNWSTAGSLAGARSEHTATMLPSGKVLVAGGYNGVVLASAEIYDPAGNTWSAAGALATARESHTATLLASGEIIVAGGIRHDGNALASAELYDPAGNNWSTAGSLATARFEHTATLLSSGKVLVVGGYNNGSIFDAELYDPAGNSWSATGNRFIASNLHSATLLLSGKVLVAGGTSGPHADLYDPTSDSWGDTSILSTGRSAHTATLLPSGQVLVAGGFDIDVTPVAALASAELYDPASNSWSPASSITIARYYHTATLLPSGKVLVAGGLNSSSNLLASAELYDPASNSWSTAGSLASSRYAHTATLLPSGQVLVAGGYSSTGLLASAELYDSASNTWSTAGSLATARDGHTATLLSSGKVLVAAGQFSGYLASAELYDPASNTWSSAGSLATARYGPTATLLSSGEVLIAGGVNGSGDLASAELYTYDLGIADSRRPVITSTTSPLILGDTVQLTGTGFTGDSEAAGGGTNSNATNSPLVQLRRIDNEQIAWTSPATNSGRSATSYQSTPLAGVPLGVYALTVFVNAIPSVSQVIRVVTAHTVTPSSSGNGSISPNTAQAVKDGTTTVFILSANAHYHPDGVTGTCGGILLGYTFTTNPIIGDCTVIANFAINTYTLAYTAGANGAISGTSPQTVNYGTSGTAVTAVPNPGYHFVQWSDNSTTNPRTDTNVTASINVTATFAINTYTLTYTAGSNGTISGTSLQTVDYGASGTSVTAVPDTNYHFVQWSDGSTTNPRTDMNVSANISVTATFAINTYTLTYTAGSNGSISGTPSQTVDYGASGTTVTAVPDTGYQFAQWSDGLLTRSRTDTNVTANISVTATFAINAYTLTYTAGSNGTIIGTSSQIVNYGANGTAVAAAPNTGYHFEQWSDGSTANPRTDSNVSANISVTASFAINTYTLTYTPGAHGSITGTTSQTVNYGASGTTVTAVPDTGYHFEQWSDSSTTNPRTDTNVSANISVTAVFSDLIFYSGFEP